MPSPAARWRSSLKYAAYINQDPDRARLMRLCRAMVAWHNGARQRVPTEEIRQALRTRTDKVRALAALALAELAARGHARVVSNLFKNASVDAAQSILFLLREFPDPLPIVKLALRHRSPMVRLSGITSAYWYCPEHYTSLTAYKPHGQTVGEVERKEEYAAILKNGYHATVNGQARSWKVQYRDGRGMCSAEVPKRVIKSIGFEAAVKHIRRYAKKHQWNVPWDEIVKRKGP